MGNISIIRPIPARPSLLPRFPALAALATCILTGCPATPPTPAPDPTITGTFTARPLTVCAGEPVTLAWNVTATVGTPALTLHAATSGGSSPGVVQFDISNLSGSRVVNPTASTGYSFSAVSDPNFASSGAFFASRAVTALTGNVPVILSLMIGWGCENDAGGPGWETLTYDAGEFASTSVQVQLVRNVSGFPVTVSLARGGAAPTTVTLDNNATTTALNGGLFLAHAWTATPSPADRFANRPQTCEDSAANGQPSNILLQITLGCGGN